MKFQKVLINTIFNAGLRDRKAGRRMLYRIANKYLDGFANRNYNIDSNGEIYVLEKLKTEPFKVIFDVGANPGDWTVAAAERFPGAVIYGFEIAKVFSDTLMQAVAGYQNVVVEDKGLGDTHTSVTIYFDPNEPGRTRIAQFGDVSNSAQEIHGEIITGDAYCQDKNISHIDFLKIDVEGAENIVLRGLSGMLQSMNISIIQFEYGLVNAHTGFLLRNFYELLGEMYVIGKLLPNGVEFLEYNTKQEDFRGANYIAVLKVREDLIEVLTSNR